MVIVRDISRGRERIPTNHKSHFFASTATGEGLFQDRDRKRASINLITNTTDPQSNFHSHPRIRGREHQPKSRSRGELTWTQSDCPLSVCGCVYSSVQETAGGTVEVDSPPVVLLCVRSGDPFS